MRASGMYVCKYALLSDVRGVRYLIPLLVTFFTILQFSIIISFKTNQIDKNYSIRKKNRTFNKFTVLSLNMPLALRVG